MQLFNRISGIRKMFLEVEVVSELLSVKYVHYDPHKCQTCCHYLNANSISLILSLQMKHNEHKQVQKNNNN